MEKTFCTVYQDGTGEIEEKKSRFIASVFEVKSEEEALRCITSVKKQYWDAKHHCYAFVIGRNAEIMRCSDDGEPAGTAGKPILSVMNGEKLTNACVIVTRYFGGTLLGTGGLIRAYTEAAKAGIAGSIIIEKKRGQLVTLKMDYAEESKIRYLLSEQHESVLNVDYSEGVALQTMIPEEKLTDIMTDVSHTTNGKCQTELGKMVDYAVVDGEVLIFEE